MPEQVTYEFAEVIVGFLNDDDGFTTFLQVRSSTGDETTAGFEGGALAALNKMGAEGWQLHAEQKATEGRVMWIWGALMRSGDKGPGNWDAREFLMSRVVRN